MANGNRSPSKSAARLPGVFQGKELNEYLVALRDDEYRGFLGSFTVQAVVGHARMDGGLLSEKTKDDKAGATGWRRVCAPINEGRPIYAMIDKSYASELIEHRIKWRVKDLSPEWEKLLFYINECKQCFCILLICKTPSLEARIVHSIYENYLSPPPRRDFCSASSLSVSFFNTMLAPSNGPFAQSYDGVSAKYINEAIDKLEAMKERAVALVVGEKNCGKSAFCRKVINYLWKKDEKPVYLMDLDIGQSEFTPPGCISCTRIDGPVLDVPFNHQETYFENAYLIGNITASETTEQRRYMEALDKLYARWLSMSPQGSVLVVNTMGWVTDFGARVLNRVIELTSPGFIFNMLGPPSTSHMRRRQFYPPPNHRSQHVLIRWNPAVAAQPKAYSLSPAQIRELTVISYFAKCLPEHRPVMSAFCEAVPYAVGFKDLCIVLPQDMLTMRDEGIFAILNVTIVALAVFEELEGAKKVEKRRMCNKAWLPWTLVKPEDAEQAWRIVGYGMIRAIDIEKRKMYILSPVPMDELQQVDCIVRISKVPVPLSILLAQPFTDKPYLASASSSSNSPNAPINDLYGGFVSRTNPMRPRF